MFFAISLCGKGSINIYQVNELVLYVQNMVLVMRTLTQKISKHYLGDQLVGLPSDRDVDQVTECPCQVEEFMML